MSGKIVNYPYKGDNSVSEIFSFKKGKKIRIPFFLSKVSAGIPSYADDYIEKYVDLNDFLVDHPDDTFFITVSGDSMLGIGIFNGDTAIVDKTIEPTNNKIVVALLDGELTIKTLKIIGNKIILQPENPEYNPIEIKKSNNFKVLGVVTATIKKH